MDEARRGQSNKNWGGQEGVGVAMVPRSIKEDSDERGILNCE
jgi:hypothetical protein